MFESGMLHDLAALVQVLLIDFALAGDNAVVVGMVVAGLPAGQRKRAIVAGVAIAALLRMGLGVITLHLLEIIGLLLAGGLLLLWVCWKMFRELRQKSTPTVPRVKSFRQAMLQIVLADLSMSLDNVLAVAGAAAGNTWVLVTGIAVAVVLMGVAANLVATLLERHRWIAWLGLLIVLYVALRLIWDGGHEVAARLGLLFPGANGA